MSSNWKTEVQAVFKKEVLSELRNLGSTFASFSLTASTVFALAFAFFGSTPPETVSAAMLWVGLLFAGFATLAKVFVAEEETKTADLLRLWATPHSVFWGKVMFSVVLMAATSLVVAVLFLVLTGTQVSNPLILVLSLSGGTLALAGLVTLVSALIARGSNRSSLVGVVALPLLLPLIALGVTATRGAFDPNLADSSVSGCVGIWLYAALIFAAAPHQFAMVWRD